MAGIIISELHPTNSESFLIEVTDMYSISVYGGNQYLIDYTFHQMLNFTYRLMDFMLSAFAIYSILSLAQSFITVSDVKVPPDKFCRF
ncbi:hypothetical protein [Nodularia sphaerocarpa]|uniref:hypothetical protein n=1 Tax=Nodularia sphaerocarpa TaxID=137816 RepID=UPI001EFA4AB1|nr:hypothetical protein [Nodularia sphaerocarpa]ULP72326.1 hypothetical protein BDGGKGIB_01965 [Nodularia sphaerocarpa UHCC 0038]